MPRFLLRLQQMFFITYPLHGCYVVDGGTLRQTFQGFAAGERAYTVRLRRLKCTIHPATKKCALPC